MATEVEVTDPRPGAAGDAAPEFSAAELLACLKVLRALRRRPDPCLSGAAPFAELLAHAAGLVRSVDGRRKAEGRERDREVIEAAGIRVRRRDGDGGDGAGTGATAGDGRGEVELEGGRRCYACKRRYARFHPFYDWLCPECGDRNVAKRGQTADMTGLVALVTGARVKIGYRVALNFLRAGAAVVATTRFPVDAAARYAREPDFDAWGHRLAVHGLDLRHLGAVVRFAGSIAAGAPRLDVLINNAAQTIRRPPAFYRHLIEAERRGPAALPPAARKLLGGPARDAGGAPPARWEGRWEGPPLPAELSQLALIPEDGDDDPATFPPGLLDADGQQVDRRGRNSWVRTLGDVTPVELVEVHAVNCLAPFLLIRGLDPLLRRDPGRGKFVVNVTAMEGQFRRGPGTGRHPHTNMAKAALDMITRACAGRYAEAGVYMNSVDTGWITNMFPHPVAGAMEEAGFQPPLDEVDGAARVCDPVFVGLNTGRCVHGKFLKDYRDVAW